MQWKPSQSAERPVEIDTTSSKVYNYARRNITEEVVEGPDGAMTVYNYDELKVEKSSWALYLDLEQARADIDYLSMITEE
jgi:hypothetical protein